MMDLEGLHRIGKADFERCALVSARAFYDDPSLRYQLGGKQPSLRELKNYFSVVLETGRHSYHFSATSPAIEGIIGWTAPGERGVPPLQFLLHGGWKLPFSTNRETLLRLKKYEENCLRIREKAGGRDACYLMMLAVDPEMQGKGYGGKMMRSFLRMLDENGFDGYLETHKRNNTEIYAHYGFRIASVDSVPGGTDAQYAMLRKAIPADGKRS